MLQKICLRCRKPTASHIFTSTLFHKRKMIQEYTDYLTLNWKLNVKKNINNIKYNNDNNSNSYDNSYLVAQRAHSSSISLSTRPKYWLNYAPFDFACWIKFIFPFHRNFFCFIQQDIPHGRIFHHLTLPLVTCLTQGILFQTTLPSQI